MAGTSGTRFIATRYPIADGIVAQTTSQQGHQESLEAEQGSTVPTKNKEGLD